MENMIENYQFFYCFPAIDSVKIHDIQNIQIPTEYAWTDTDGTIITLRDPIYEKIKKEEARRAAEEEKKAEEARRAAAYAAGDFDYGFNCIPDQQITFIKATMKKR